MILELVRDAVALLGAGLVITALALVYVPLALAAAGVGLIGLAILLRRPEGKPAGKGERP